MKLLQIILVIALGSLLWSCGIGAGGARGMTPEQAVERANPIGVDEQRVYAVTFTPKGALVLYRNLNAKPDEFSMGHAFVTRSAFGWEANEMGSAGGSLPRDEPMFLMVGRPELPPDRNIVYAMTHDPQIRNMRVRFANGVTLTDDVNNSMVGVVIEPKSAACRVEFTNAQDQILYAYDIAQNLDAMMFSDSEVNWAKKECQ